MKKSIAFAAAALTMMALAADANAWTRSGSATGPRGGTWSSQGSGSCSGGSCSHSGTVTGPNGGTSSYGGSTSCSGGSCTHNGTVTGPNGGTRSRTTTWSR